MSDRYTAFLNNRTQAVPFLNIHKEAKSYEQNLREVTLLPVYKGQTKDGVYRWGKSCAICGDDHTTVTIQGVFRAWWCQACGRSFEPPYDDVIAADSSRKQAFTVTVAPELYTVRQKMVMGGEGYGKIIDNLSREDAVRVASDWGANPYEIEGELPVEVGEISLIGTRGPWNIEIEKVLSARQTLLLGNKKNADIISSYSTQWDHMTEDGKADVLAALYNNDPASLYAIYRLDRDGFVNKYTPMPFNAYPDVIRNWIIETLNERATPDEAKAATIDNNQLIDVRQGYAKRFMDRLKKELHQARYNTSEGGYKLKNVVYAFRKYAQETGSVYDRLKPVVTYWYENEAGERYVPTDKELEAPYTMQELMKGEYKYQHLRMPVVEDSIATLDGELMHGEATINNAIEPIVLELVQKKGWSLVDAITTVAVTCERCLNILLEQATGEPYTEKDRVHTHCELCATIDPEYDRQYKEKEKHKTAQHDILDDFFDKNIKDTADEYLISYKQKGKNGQEIRFNDWVDAINKAHRMLKFPNKYGYSNLGSLFLYALKDGVFIKESDNLLSTSKNVAIIDNNQLIDVRLLDESNPSDKAKIEHVKQNSPLFNAYIAGVAENLYANLINFNALHINGVAFRDLYAKPYVRKVVDGIMNGLTVLAAVSLDISLLFWVRGLKATLDNRMRAARAEVNKKRSEITASDDDWLKNYLSWSGVARHELRTKFMN